MRTIRTLVVTFGIAMLAGCVSTRLLTYDGPRVLHGQGGSKETIEGVDFWRSGAPYGSFEILVSVADEYRSNSSLLGNAISKSSAQSRLIRLAKEHGADGILFISSSTTPWGSSGRTTGSMVHAPGGTFSTGTAQTYTTQKFKVSREGAHLRFGALIWPTETRVRRFDDVHRLQEGRQSHFPTRIALFV